MRGFFRSCASNNLADCLIGVANVFTESAPDLLVYTSYCAKFQVATDLPMARRALEGAHGCVGFSILVCVSFRC